MVIAVASHARTSPLRQSAPIPLLSSASNVSHELPPVKGLVLHKNVALGAPGVGLIALIQDHNCVPHMEVCKVNPEVGPV